MREQLTDIFKDTMYLCNNRRELKEDIQRSLAGQSFIGERERLVLEEKTGKGGIVKVTGNRTLEAAREYGGRRVCVLNFASARNPGGGVTRGASAQEECLCRISTLYPCLNSPAMKEKFYAPHRYLDALYNDDMIYTPDITVFKSDTGTPSMLEEKDWYQVDVISCAAPNKKGYQGKLKESQLQGIFERRLERVALLAASRGCEVLILGAFGCGAFGNYPGTVADAACRIVEKYRSCFDTLEFAIYCPSRDLGNYKAFQSVLQKFM
ncbi:MAG: TIGR02452 family protein [Lachnospiraceae bacterium]|nr:TIGR02452 family protein [Lachnospiraceae bacterium]